MNLLCIDLKSPSFLYRVIVCYLPPPVSRETVLSLKHLFDRIIDPKIPTIVCGDFNLPNFDWLVAASVGDAVHDVFLTTIVQNNLRQLVHEPTRNSSILDLCSLIALFSYLSSMFVILFMLIVTMRLLFFL